MRSTGTSSRISKSPTLRLLLGLLITLAAITGFSSSALHELRNLRKLQNQTIDANRHDSLLLLEIQNDLNAVGLKLRDMVQSSQESKIHEMETEFKRVRADLEDSIKDEAKLAPVTRHTPSQAKLVHSLQEFRLTSDEVFRQASLGHVSNARALALSKLAPQQSALAAMVLSLLERNNEAEQRADQKIASIYGTGERNIYAFQAGCMITIVITSLYLIYSNRRIFERLESLSRQRRVLTARLLSVQEEVLRSVARELHDEFGQILTAVSAMLSRAERKGVPPDSPLRTELSEVREITHNTLEKMRSLSQMLHPSVIDDYGLEKGIAWYAEVFQKQTGIVTTVITTGTPVRITGQLAIHTFRIVQEALNNTAKHSGAKRAEVEMIFAANTLTVRISDFGRGFLQTKKPGEHRGIGLVGMRERAELLSAKLEIASIPSEGTTVILIMPLDQEPFPSGSLEESSISEVATL